MNVVQVEQSSDVVIKLRCENDVLKLTIEHLKSEMDTK